MTKLAATTMLEPDGAVARRSAVADAIAERSTWSDTNTLLVRRAQSGDAAAFDDLARVRIDRSYRSANAILRSEADARDAVQDAYVAAWRQLPKLREPARFDAWLDRIVINSCRMALRHRRVVHVHEIYLGDHAEGLNGASSAWSPAPDVPIVGADVVARAFEHLGADHRALLILHHVEDRPIDEIALVLGLPGGTVKWRLHQARAALQRALEEESR